MVMTEREKQLFLIFRQAVESERDAQAMYRQAMTVCDHPEIHRLLERLHEEEVAHERDLMVHYTALKERFQIL